ncbi:ZIP family zinc transporter [Nocardiopsis arvandica]|uniref:ZIP family zinc transporter n=1 Tax=Nocardiopsis sinuspersici TaxID=501010 RepID=A0A7Y9XER8_9ACTN|nr:ZIP family zinc transporter [Nocardiopsis sinuspersici]
MEDLLLVMLLALVPAAANILGGLVAEVVSLSERVFSAALHLAVGIVIAVIGLELMPRALAAEPAWAPLVAFTVGGGLFLGVDALSGFVQARVPGRGGGGSLGVYFGVALDLFSDGVMIGTGSVINPALGLLLAVGQAPADLPEGFAAQAAFRRAGVARRWRVLAGAGFTVPILFGAVLGYLVLREAPEVVTLSVLSFTGGALLSVVIEEMIPKAHEARQSRLDSFYLTVGFVVFAVVALWLG